MLIRNAHEAKDDFTSIVSFDDNFRLATRNTDNTMKVWDLRKFTKPIHHHRDLPNRFSGNKMCFSPNGQYLLVGTSVGKGIEAKNGYVHFYDTTSLEKVKSLDVGTVSVFGLTWSPVINQIVVGTSSGSTLIYLDQRLSRMGALKAYKKEPRVDKDPYLGYTAPVYLPHSLPLYVEKPTNTTRKDQLQIRRNPLLSEKPLFPTQGPHKNGRQNDKAYNFIQYTIQSLNSNPEKVEDARKPLWELQKYAKEKQEFTSAYEFTQPQPIFHESPSDTKEFQFLQTLEKICPHCGLKLCTCVRKEFYDSQDEQDEEEEPAKK
jgi:WD repeat-containing protein 70